MKILLAVIDDLYTFAVDMLFRRGRKKETAPDSEDEKDTTSEAVEELIQAGEEEHEKSESRPAFRSMEDIFKENEAKGYAVDTTSGEKNTVMYIGGSETPLYLRPTREFDSVVVRLPYGTMVMVLEHNGRWVNVAHNEQKGWVLREDLVDRAAFVYPQFILGEQNSAEDPNTIRIRAMLDDMFAGGAAELNLQDAEYVMYRLMRKGLAIEWPSDRPRTPGLWHKLLKGTQGTHVGISPKTGSIMEYMYTEDQGHLAFVEAVFPDETINISEANFPDSGIYNERVLTREEWRELKPLFIQVV